MNGPSKAALLKSIKAVTKRIAKERDHLRLLIDDLESLHDDTQEALSDLENAADALSRSL